MQNLVLLRHGRSMGNEKRLVKNEQENLLTAQGLADALGHAIKFRENNPEFQFDVVFSSPLPRAKQTCYNFLSATDHDAREVIIVDDFRERHFGLEGYLPDTEIEALYGIGEVGRWFNDMECKPCGMGETPRELYQRVSNAFEAHVRPQIQAGKKVLVVSHYATMGALVAHIVDNDVEKTLSRSFRNGIPYEFTVK